MNLKLLLLFCILLGLTWRNQKPVHTGAEKAVLVLVAVAAFTLAAVSTASRYL